ncbi:MAG: sensor histidine kinase, partial [Bacteroidia bacterium]|nr:sensor histidine kinase [Bacteroidia bacterium]
MKFFRVVTIAFFFYGSNTYSQNNLLLKAKAFDNIDSSIKYAEKFLEAAKLKKDSSALIDCFLYLNNQYTLKSKYTKAEKLIQEALIIALKTKDVTKQNILYLELADIYNYKNENEKALSTYLKAYDLFEQANDKKNLLTCMINTGEFYRKTRAFNDAALILRKGFDYYKKNKFSDTTSLIRLNNRLAAVMIESLHIDSSIYYSKKALQRCVLSKNKYAEATSLNEIGYAYKNALKLDSAIFYYKKAESIWFSIGAEREALSALNNRGMLYQEFKYPKKLIFEVYSQILDSANINKVHFPLADVYHALNKQYLQLEDTNKAYIFLENYYKEQMIVLKNLYDASVEDIKEKYENEKIKEEITSVSTKLTTSEQLLIQKDRENKIMYIFLFVLILSISSITYLFFQNRKANQLLKRKNLEKDALIQEIHHRVKNNLQFVSSLINMQINTNNSAGGVYSLNDASRRIRAMALVHEMLYNQNEVKGININLYVHELIASINDLVNNNNLPLNFKVDIDAIIFDAEKSIALGMIASELVSNAIKYAFKNNANPQV